MPAVPGWAVIRPRIDKLLADGARGPLTSVTGPPGAGKTMAVAAWATSTSYPCTLAWVNVDDYDNRPRVFWSYVVAALRKAGIAVPQVVPGPGRVAVDHAFLVRLASTLAAQDPPVVLVLDDFHLLTEPAVLDGLAYVLRNAWPGLHLMVVSRADPLLPLHRYRLAGQLAEIRADDLAFSMRGIRCAAGPSRRHAVGPGAGTHYRADGGLGGGNAPGRDFPAGTALTLSSSRRSWKRGTAPSPAIWWTRSSTPRPPRYATCCCGPASWTASAPISPPS